jgi:hypothetical protein
METGDRYARDQYDKCIRNHQLPDDILGIIRNQAQAIVGLLERVRVMRKHRKVA